MRGLTKQQFSHLTGDGRNIGILPSLSELTQLPEAAKAFIEHGITPLDHHQAERDQVILWCIANNKSELLAYFIRCCGITELKLAKQAIGNAGAIVIANVLLRDPNLLTVLDLHNNAIGPVGVAALCDALCHGARLNVLDLGSNELGEDGVKALSEVIARNNALTSLDLSYTSLGLEGAVTLAAGLRINTSLKLLNLSGNAIQDNGAISLFEALSGNAQLNSLNLANNGIGPVAFAKIALTLKANTGLVHLSLRGNAIGDDGMIELAQAIQSNTTLRSLVLAKCGIRSNGMQALANALKINSKSLRELDLSGNGLNSRAVSVLSESLAQHQALVTLDLSHNDIDSNVGCAALSYVLIWNTCLASLNLGHNRMGSDGAFWICVGLWNNRSLRFLNLSNNHIRHLGESMTKMLLENRNLTSINLSRNKIDRNGVVAIYEGVESNLTLCELRIDAEVIDDIHVGFVSCIDVGHAINRALYRNSRLADRAQCKRDGDA